MGRIYLDGIVPRFKEWIDARNALENLLQRLSNVLNGQLDDTNIYPGGLTSASMQVGGLLAVSMADHVGYVDSITYVGDGTANRTVSLGFTARRVLVLRTDATSVTFESIAVLGVAYSWWRDAAGAYNTAATGWQGIVTNGIKLGSNVANLSNANGVTYVVAAYK